MMENIMAKTQNTQTNTQANEPNPPMSRNGLNKFLMASATVPVGVAEKAQMTSEIRQRLAEVHDLEAQGGDKAKEAENLAAKQIIRLYQARVSGQLSGEETSGILGDSFGYRQKKDGKPSKTPEGLGKAIRDRLNRLVDANEYTSGRTATAFFDGLPVDTTRAVLNSVIAGKASPWDGHKAFSELRAKVNTRPPLAFDASRVLKIAASLDEEGAVSRFRNNPNLMKAYGELMASLTAIGDALDQPEVETEGETVPASPSEEEAVEETITPAIAAE